MTECTPMGNLDIICTFLQFVGEGQFVFCAPVSTNWKKGWGNHPTVTRWITADSSMSQLLYGFKCGLPRDLPELCRALASCCKVELLECAREHGCPWDERPCRFAAAGENLTTLQWARENDSPWDAWTCQSAAVHGSSVGPGKWLSVTRAHVRSRRGRRALGCSAVGEGEQPSVEFWDVFQRSCGHVLQWARKNGCRWNDATCSSAAGAGYLVVLQWARENGSPWDDMTLCCSSRRSPGRSSVGPRQQLPVELEDVCCSCQERVSIGVEVGQREWVPVGRADVLVGR